MELTYLGHSSFLFKTKTGRLVTDPFGRAPGFLQPLTEADAVTISHDHYDHNDLSRIAGSPLIIRGPGEYEVRGFSITGMMSWHDRREGADRGSNTIYLIEAEEMRWCHLGDQGAVLTDRQREQLGRVDGLLVPVGGKFTLDPAAAWEVVQAVGPRLVIPMHYKTGDHGPAFAGLTGVDEFIRVSGLEPKQEKKLMINKLSLPEETELVILER